MHARIAVLAEEWRDDRAARMRRRHLDRADFDRLEAAGYLRAAVPRSLGGTWDSVEASTRGIADALRVLASGDASVALVAAMHPSVLGYWLANFDPGRGAWRAQAEAAFATAADGAQWGTITSEPGSGGDIMRTRTRAEPVVAENDGPPGDGYVLTGDKHFGSGFGVADYMFTTALADGDDMPSAYFMDVREFRTGAAPGLTVTAEWDGAGMIATQSHAARLEAMPATRLAWPGDITVLALNAAPLITTLFTAVVLGVLDAAMTFTREQLAPKREAMRAYEQVEWSRADLDHWIAQQAYEGALRAVEAGDCHAALGAGLRAKTAVAEAAERALSRVTRVVGGASFARRSPLASWYEDVRALGFLRPPWGLAFDGLYASSFDRTP